MKSNHPLLLGIVFCCLFNAVHLAHGQSTAFTYQGRLNESNSPASGIYDLRFTVFDSSAGPTSIVGPITQSAVVVSNGLFTVTLDFGAGVFTGSSRWLDIAVRTNGNGVFATLNPRQALTPSPYAIFANTASNVVNGSVVKSVNTLTDNVVLQAGSNVTITPVGNALTIAAAGVGGSGIWSVNGNKTYYNAGNVGVGTNDPANKITTLTPANSAGFEHTDGNVRLATSLASTGGNGSGALGTLSPHRLNFFVNNGPPSATLGTNGAFGIGTTTPRNGLKLEVNGGAIFTAGGSGGDLQIGAPNGESGLTIIGSGRADLRFDGATVKLLAGPAGGPPSSLSGIAVDTAGRVGIGTTSPSSKLHVAGDVYLDGQVIAKNTQVNQLNALETYCSQLSMGRINGLVNINNGGYGNVTMALRARAGDKIPFYVVDSSGNVLFYLETAPNQLLMFGNAAKSVGGTSWAILSDERLKQNVQPFEPGLNEILQLRPVRFHYRDGVKPGLTSAHEEIGFIAQEVRAVIPEAVTQGQDGYLMLKADPIHWAGINAIKELNQKLEAQRAENVELKQRLEKLEQLMADQLNGGKQ